MNKKFNGKRIAVVYRAKKSLLIFTEPVLLIISTYLFLHINGLLVLLSVVSGISSMTLLWRRTIEYCFSDVLISDNQLTIRSGLFKRRNLEYLLIHISGITIEKNLLGYLFDSGKIILNVSGKKQFPIKNIVKPHLFRSQLYYQIKELYKDLKGLPDIHYTHKYPKVVPYAI